MAKEFKFEKLTAFKGSVLKELKAPTNYRSYAATCRKMIKLYMRMQEDQIFYPALFTSFKQITKLLYHLGRTQFKDKTPENLVEYLDEMATSNPYRWLEVKHMMNLQEAEVIVEESRERREGSHCSFCKVELHFPAYVIHRNETKVLHKSRSIGVKCLRTQTQKLKTFLNAPQVQAALNGMELQLGLGASHVVSV